MLEARLLLGLFFATALVFWLTPVAIRVAARLNFYDKPIGYKGHSAPTPYLGGAPVVLAFVAVLAVLTSDWQRTLPLAGGVMVLWALGTLDDRRTVSPGLRVAVEAAFAALLFAVGNGWNLGGPPVLGLVVTIVWVVGVVNALNLFDNMDGAASSIALVISAGVAVTAAVQGDGWLAIAAAGLAGACLGFLPHNLAKPARIFLGDGGSMPIGFALAVLVMMAAADRGPAWQTLAMGLLLVGVPALDTCLVIVSRTRRGISVLQGGRDHLTHRTYQRLQTTRAVAFALGAMQALLAILALFASRESSEVLLLVVLLYLAGAAATIAVLDRGAERTIPPHAAANRVTSRWLQPRAAILAVLGLGAGISPFLGGYYDQTKWAPIGIGLIVLLTALGVARAASLSRPAVVAVASLAGLGLLAVISSGSAGSATSAVVNGNRYVVYAAFLALVLMLARDRSSAVVVLGGFTLGAIVVGVVDLARALDGDIDQLFIGGRLNGPLGYINGQGSFFLLAVWPSFALAAQTRRRWLAGGGLAAATLFVGLAAMAQSRGVVLAAVVSLIAVMVLVPGRLRRAAALSVIAGAIAVVAPDLIAVFDSATPPASISVNAVHDAAVALIVASIIAGAVWMVALQAERLLRVRSERAVGTLRIGIATLFALAAVATFTLLALKSEQIGNEVRRQYHAFVHLDRTQGGESTTGRLASGGGNRYDYWRIAARVWEDDPVTGIGGGNYPQPYYRMRSTTEAILQPHSIELQTLAELGLIGGLLLVVLLGVVAVGVARARAPARRSDTDLALLVTCVGTITAWSVHTSVDWIHLLPGVTAVPLIAIAVLLRPAATGAAEPTAATSRPAWLQWRRLAVAGFAAVALTLAATSLTRQALGDWFRERAKNELASSPGEALKWADRSLRLDPDAPSTYYVKAAAIARFGAGPQAVRVLEAAIEREPGNFLTYALLGDLYARQGKTALAKRAYAAALVRNPREPSLLELADSPAPSPQRPVR
jgi:UDP-GlcNAc:undecaprenyl-phosphate GlcNAc-1-phosphate transferase